jgi:DNA adenine methylase
LPPQPFQRYFEPFLGGGALFFDLAPSAAVLSDSNPELMLCYEVVRDCPEDLISEYSAYKVNESEFYRMRALKPEHLAPVARAARFLYLNKTCYNGLYRVNKKGRFNTPYGRYTDVSLAEPENLRAASGMLQRACLLCEDYQQALAGAEAGDFVYLDPPYLPVGKYADFKRYTKAFFYEKDHRSLAEVFGALSARGCFVLLSNSFHEKISKLYSGLHQLTVEVPRFISCKGEGRGKVKELLIANYPFRFGT